ncbi:MAG: hypothetical protein J5764_03905 [Bacteroidales bacterium]|nr:hypothetical protein [Bacteroidales bacterium]
MRKCLAVIVSLLLLSSLDSLARQQWTAEYAQNWWDRTEWPLGFTIDLPAGEALPDGFVSELGRCTALGCNTVRLVLDCSAADASKTIKQLARALSVIQPSGLRAAVVLTPGDALSAASYGRYSKMAATLVSDFKEDGRILYWNLLPSPEQSLSGFWELQQPVAELFRSVRAAEPSQPLCGTVICPYVYDWRLFGRMDIFSAITLESDIVALSFTGPVSELTDCMKTLSVFRRPVVFERFICRENEATIDRALPIIKREKAAAFFSFADIWPDGKHPYSIAEPDMIRRLAMNKQLAGEKASWRETGWGISAPDPACVRQWSERQARDWWALQEWPVGCCMVPGTCVNQYDIWQAETFDIASISTEFALCRSLGFNLVRIYLHEDLWFRNAAGFKERIGEVLDIAERNGIRLTFTFCTNGGSSRPVMDGKQVRGAGWAQSPKDEIFFDESQWPRFKAYMQDILRSFAHDSRILYWLIWNEPENLQSRQRRRDVMKIMDQMYKWAWEVRPDQPLASSPWFPFNPNGSQRIRYDVEAYALRYSDIAVFHCYRPPKMLENYIQCLSRFRRPMVCEEYMARDLGSFFDLYMPILKREKVAAINWGLVHPSAPGTNPSAVWRHGIFYNDCKTPYNPAEVEYIRSFCADKSAAGQESIYKIYPNN